MSTLKMKGTKFERITRLLQSDKKENPRETLRFKELLEKMEGIKPLRLQLYEPSKCLKRFDRVKEIIFG